MGRCMRVLIVSQHFWPENFRINDLAVGLKDRGHEVTVLAGLPNYPSGRFPAGYGLRGPWTEEFQGVRILRLPVIPRGDGGGIRMVLNYVSFALAGILLGPWRCRSRYDVILASGLSPLTAVLPAIVLKLSHGTPLACWVLDLWPETLSATGAIRSSFILGAVERMMRFIYRKCDRILIASPAFDASIQAHAGRPEQIRYFPNWAEPDYTAEPTPAPMVAQLPALPSGFRVMFAGNIGASQAFGTVLDAAERVAEKANVQWIIIGDGRQAPWVHDEVRRRGLTGQVHFLGQYPSAAMPRFFAQADAMLVTLKRDPSFALTVPGKIQSYLASGKPILAALDGAGRRLIEDTGAGFACPAEDGEGLAAAVLRLVALSEAERTAMGESGRRYCAANFERNILFERIDGWLSEIASTKKAALTE